VRDRAELGAIFTRLCEQVANDLNTKGYAGKTIGIKLRYDNFQSVTRDVTLDSFTADPATIRRQAGLCLKRVDLSRRIRLLGVRVGKLVKPGTDGTLPQVYSEPASPSPPKHKTRHDRNDLLFPELDG
jgi:DNA polymerase-4